MEDDKQTQKKKRKKGKRKEKKKESECVINKYKLINWHEDDSRFQISMKPAQKPVMIHTLLSYKCKVSQKETCTEKICQENMYSNPI